MQTAAAGRNTEPILEVLRNYLPQRLRSRLSPVFVLEVASGYGSHLGYFAKKLTRSPIVWQPTDISTSYFPSITRHCTAAVAETGALVSPPVVLDVTEQTWSVHHTQDAYWTNPKSIDPVKQEDIVKAFDENKERKFDLVFNINMLYISPRACTPGLFSGVASVLCPQGRLMIYGGAHVSTSSEMFDLSLKRENPEYGVPNLDALVEIANSNGLEFITKVPMPANNFTLIFERN